METGIMDVLIGNIGNKVRALFTSKTERHCQELLIVRKKKPLGGIHQKLEKNLMFKEILIFHNIVDQQTLFL